jgi:hypothetical protein
MADDRLLLICLSTPGAQAYYDGAATYAQWRAEAELHHQELLLVVREAVSFSRTRLEPPEFLQHRLGEFRPSCVLHFGDGKAVRWVSAYIPVVAVSDPGNMRLVQAATEIADIAKAGYTSVEECDGCVTLRRR